MTQPVGTFQFLDHEFNVYRINEKDMFKANDIGLILGIKNIRDVTRKLPPRWKDVVLTDTLGGKQNMVFISEPALYEIAFHSRKPKAREFVEWVCEEVLPSIRKTGSYHIPVGEKHGYRFDYDCTSGHQVVDCNYDDDRYRISCTRCRNSPNFFKNEERLKRHHQWHDYCESRGEDRKRLIEDMKRNRMEKQRIKKEKEIIKAKLEEIND